MPHNRACAQIRASGVQRSNSSSVRMWLRLMDLCADSVGAFSIAAALMVAEH